MKLSSKKSLTCLVCLVAGLAGPVLADEKISKGQSPIPVKLLHLPAFSVAGKLTEDTQETFTGWATKQVPKAIKKEPFAVDLKEIDPETADVASLDSLPGARPAQVAEILSPFCDDFETDGALLYWLERESKSDPFRMVSLLYLPERIQLEQFRVSTNYERQNVELTEGKLEEKDFEEALRTVLRRNLRRIVASETEPVEDETNNDLAPTNKEEEDLEADEEGNDLAPVKKKSKKKKPKQKKQDDSEDAKRADSALLPDERWYPDVPRSVGILPFSREFRDSGPDLKARYDVDFDFRDSARRAFEELTGIRAAPLGGPPVTYGQMAAPVLVALDPDADPRAKQKWLAKRCEQGGVDALMFGHLRQGGGHDGSEMSVYLRVFQKDGMILHEKIAPWHKNVSNNQIEDGIRIMAQSLASEIGWKVVAREPRDVAYYTVKRGENLFKIARWCYGDHGRFVTLLKELNNIENENMIQTGQNLKLPKTLGGLHRKSRCRVS